MQRSSLALRWFAALSTGALVVHQARYALAFGDREALQRRGHAYLDGVVPLLVLVLIAALGQTIATLVRRRVEQDHGIALRWTWLAASSALAAVFVVQELAEGALSAGHASGLHGVFGHGGWLALPLAVVLGGAISWVLGLVRRTLDEGREPVLRFWLDAGMLDVLRQATETARALVAPMAGLGAGRAPPVSA